MLEKYLESGYADAPLQEKLAFRELLALQDTELLAYLMGNKTAEKADMADLIAKMRAASAQDTGK